jgi:hypothetical protein
LDLQPRRDPWLVAVLAVVLCRVLAGAAYAAPVEVPAQLVAEVQAYAQQAADDDGSVRHGLAQRLHDWIGESARTAPLKEVVAGLARGLTVKPDDPKWTWRERVALLESPPTENRVMLRVAQWQGVDRAVAVFTAMFVGGAEGSAKLFSAPFLVVTQKGKETRTQTLEDGDNPSTPTLSSVLAFVPSGAALPDLLLGWCVVGSGIGLNLKQFHRGDRAGALWDAVWKEEFIDVTNFTFDTRRREASIRWQDGVGATVPYELYVSVVKLAAGRKAVIAPMRRVK